MSEIPSFDKMIIALLGLLGASAGILTLVGVAFALHSWYSGVKGIVTGVRVASTVLGRLGAAVIGMRPVQVAVAGMVTIMVLLAQALTVGLCYLGGNFLSLSFDRNRGDQIEAAIAYNGFRFLHPEVFTSYLALDWVAGGYLIVAIAAIAFSYRVALDDGDLGIIGGVLALPATVPLFVLGPLLLIALAIWGVFGLLALLVGEGSAYFSDSVPALKQAGIPMSVVTAYFGTCQAAVYGSRLLVRTWGA